MGTIQKALILDVIASFLALLFCACGNITFLFFLLVVLFLPCLAAVWLFDRLGFVVEG